MRKISLISGVILFAMTSISVQAAGMTAAGEISQIYVNAVVDARR